MVLADVLRSIVWQGLNYLSQGQRTFEMVQEDMKMSKMEYLSKVWLAPKRG